MATAAAAEKTEEELRKEIDELHRQQREITERLRDPRGLRRGGLSAADPRNFAANGGHQRGFVRPHGDEEAVIKSFKDINTLIKEMLELKAKYSAVEAELKEMHDRYSQLSLQFAEVEGDRQKLKMTLKNVRASRKLLQLNHSPSTTNTELSS